MNHAVFRYSLAFALVFAWHAIPPNSLAQLVMDNLTAWHSASDDKKTAPGPSTSEPDASLSLEWARAAAISRHPAIAATREEILAREGAAQQAGLWRNPSLFGEIEEFGGSGDFSGTDSMSSRIGISQEFSLGGKLSKRWQEAKTAVRIAELEHLLKINEITALVEKRFFEVFTLQERLRLQTEQFDFIRKTHEVVAKRIQAGDTSPLDLARSRIELATAKIAIEQTRNELETSRYALAVLWGSEVPGFSRVSAQFRAAPETTLEKLREALQHGPAWLLQDKLLAQAGAALSMAERQGLPDLELAGGFQQFNESDDHAFFLGLSIPLPLFDRNQGGIAEAQAMKRRARHEKETAALSLHLELQEAWSRLLSARLAVQAFESEVLPAAQQAYDSIGKAYKTGEMDILGLLDTQRTWVETRLAHLILLHELENSRIEIKRLIGEEESFPAAANDNSTN